MHTNGLVLTLETNADRHALIDEITQAGPFTLGDTSGPRWPLVLETADPSSARDWHEWAARRPGVFNVDVVFVHWDESEPDHART